jgi:hypothetical protein
LLIVRAARPSVNSADAFIACRSVGCVEYAPQKSLESGVWSLLFEVIAFFHLFRASSLMALNGSSEKQFSALSLAT